MKLRRLSVGLLVGMLSVSAAIAADPRAEFEAQLGRAIARLNHDVAIDVNGPGLVAELIRREYGTRAEELRWAVDHSIPWGDLVALAYIQATTGRSFEVMTKEGAPKDFWAYVDKAGMSPDKMTRSLENFLKSTERERNSRIFDRLRASRRVEALPDLGSGFGLFQEALDFRRLDTTGPTKIHIVVSGKAKGNP
jgi:hypothetical protein